MKLKSVNVRLAQPAEMQAVKLLWSESFSDTDPYLSWYFDAVSLPENTVVCTADGKVAASLQLIDYDVSIGGRIYKTCYIAGVCTDKEFRHKGYGTKIMLFAEQEAARRGKDFVFLYPMVVGFYEPIGYKLWFSLYENEILPDEAAKQPCRKATEDDIDYIMQVYNDFAGKHSGYVGRTRQDFMHIMKYHELLCGGIYLPEEGGYFAFEMDKQCMRVNELICPLDAIKGVAECEKIIVRSKDNFGNGENKPKFLYRVCSDMDENVFKEKGQYINILY